MRLRRYTVDLTETTVRTQTVTFVADMDAQGLDLDLVAAGYASSEGWSTPQVTCKRGSVGSEDLTVEEAPS